MLALQINEKGFHMSRLFLISQVGIIALQKKFKEERGPLFSWRTGWLDQTIETELLDNYSERVHILRNDGTRNMTPREESFYS